MLVGKWENASDWSLGVPPAINQSAIVITNAISILHSSKTVTIDATTSGGSPGTMTISNLTVSAPAGLTNILQLTNAGMASPLTVLTLLDIADGGVLTVTGSLLVNTNYGAQLILGHNGHGTLIASNGAVQAFQLYAGAGVAGSSGTITFMAATNSASSFSIGASPGTTGTIWASRSFLVATDAVGVVSIGNFGAGQMTTSNTSLMAGDMEISRFAGAQGALTSVGGTNTITRDLQLATDTGTTADVSMVSGQLTIANGGSVTIGVKGTGELLLSNMTVLASGPLYVGGGYANSVGTVTSVDTTNTLSSFVSIAPGVGSEGTVWLSGGLWVATNDVFLVGNFGNGYMNLSNGTLQASDLVISRYGGSSGYLAAWGGILDVSSNLTIGDCALGAVGNLTVLGASVFVTNTTHSAALDVRQGHLALYSGHLVVDTLVVTSSCAQVLRFGGTLSALITNLSPNLSAAGDGIPNGWKQQYNLDPFDPNLAAEDPDGDGVDNLEEYLAGTDPTNGLSWFHITAVARENSDIRVSWSTGLGKTNALQAATIGNYATNALIDIFIVTNTVGTVTNDLDVGAATNRPARFYRVRLVP